MKLNYVIWKDLQGMEHYNSFKTSEQAYDFMIKKLSDGLWACIPSKHKVNIVKTNNRK